MTRRERIRNQLRHLERHGVVTLEYEQGAMPGHRWIITPAGLSTRVLTTSEAEGFLLGAMAALHALKVT